MPFTKGHKINLGRKRSEFSREWRDNLIQAHKEWAIENKDLLSSRGALGAKKRWENHIKVEKPASKRKYAKLVGTRLEKKRFNNQRYKANKRNAFGSHTFAQWIELKNKYQNMCLCCKQFEPFVKLTEDHIVPLSLGGSDLIENIQPLCQGCNRRKHAKTIFYLPVVNNQILVS